MQGGPTLVPRKKLMKGVEQCIGGHAPCGEAVIKGQRSSDMCVHYLFVMKTCLQEQ